MGVPTTRLGVALLAGLLSLAGCDLLSPTPVVVNTEPQPLDPVEEERPSPDPEGITTTLLDAGAEPRQELRYRYQMGVPERTRISVDSTVLGRDFDGSAVVFEGTHTFEAVVTPRLKKGLHLIQYDAEVPTSSTARRRTDNIAQMITEVRDEALEGGVAKGIYTDRGLQERISPRYSRIPDRSAARAVADAWDSVGSLPVPFPVEAVGVGARWTTENMSEDVEGAEYPVVTTWTLTSFDGERGQVTLSQSVDVKDISLKVSRLPKGTTVVLQEALSRGEGAYSFDLSRFAPTSGKLQGSGSSRYLATLPINGEKRRKVEFQVAVTIESVELADPASPE